jgi:hypothetical protein
MPFPTTVIFLLVLFTTGMAALCVTVGLCLFAVRGYKALAPYIAYVLRRVDDVGRRTGKPRMPCWAKVSLDNCH